MNRRLFLQSLAASAAAAAQMDPLGAAPRFRLGIINDEVSPDLEKSLRFMAEHGLRQVELRVVNGKNVMKLTEAEASQAASLVRKMKFRVSNLATPIYKVDIPGHKTQEGAGDSFGAEFPFEEQKNLLKKAISLARIFDTKVLRIFTFWRIPKPEEVFDDVVRHLRELIPIAREGGVILGVENEHACNIGTGKEAGRLLKALNDPVIQLVWDPGNAFLLGETPYPNGYNHVRGGRIVHIHIKDALARKGPGVDAAQGSAIWAPVGKGKIDYVGQFAALRRDGYRNTISLETHYYPGGDRLQGTRESLAGLLRLVK